MKKSKRYVESAKLVDSNKDYEIKEALDIIEKMPKTKFDQTVELHVKLGVDSKHADQQVRGTVVLPNGTGKTQRVLVFAKGPKADEAEKAGADFVGAEELIPRIQNDNWFDYDVLMNAIIKAKPAAAKGQYIKGVSISTTMGPGLHINQK